MDKIYISSIIRSKLGLLQDKEYSEFEIINFLKVNNLTSQYMIFTTTNGKKLGEINYY